MLGGLPLPEELFDQLLADSGDRNGAAYEEIIAAEATWS